MPIYEATKQTAIDVLKSLFVHGSSTYTKIYLSFGSKFNEKQVMYGLTTIPDHATNAPFQMFPAFLRDYSESDRILAICIDDFSNIENKETNRKIIGSVIQDSVDFVFVDWNLQIFDFYTFMHTFLKILLENEIQSFQFYCVVYFKFVCPNSMEEAFSDKIAELAVTIFKDSLYRNSLFIWFGYHPNLYNFIYPAYYSFTYYTNNLTVIQKRFHYEAINTFVLDDWISTLDPNTQSRISTFLTNCFDITQYSNDGNLWSIYQGDIL
jgi:hypothetical protein